MKICEIALHKMINSALYLDKTVKDRTFKIFLFCFFIIEDALVYLLI